jgi:chromosomal replication initiation ATPase DnaA
MHRQLTLELPHIPSLDGDDFFVSGSNEQAVKLVNSWPNWTNPINIVAGPTGSGKTHLVNVWRARSGATCFSAQAMEDAVALALEQAVPIAIEDIDHATFNENAAFHLLNLARERRFDVLITARCAPGTWAISLPDLRSRLRSAALVNIGEPDEALLRAVLVKLFTDRQLSITPDVIDYLMLRMERSMAAAQTVVEALDKAALVERRAVTRPLAGKILTISMPADAKDETR